MEDISAPVHFTVVSLIIIIIIINQCTFVFLQGGRRRRRRRKRMALGCYQSLNSYLHAGVVEVDENSLTVKGTTLNCTSHFTLFKRLEKNWLKHPYLRISPCLFPSYLYCCNVPYCPLSHHVCVCTRKSSLPFFSDHPAR